MASQSSIQFIDAALFFPTTFLLSYTDPDQKWLIRSHLLSLLQNFPFFRPSMASFTHNDGTIANLLNVSGDLQVSRNSTSTPPVPLMIWLHENYPHMAPIVLVSSNSTYPIQRDNPFVDPSGLTTSAYLQSWCHPKSNLFDLVQNLVRIFSHNHPLFNTSNNLSTLSHPSLVSKREAMDRLSCTLHYDLKAFRAQSEEEIHSLSALQGEMAKRVDFTRNMIAGLEREKSLLKRRVQGFAEQGDVLMNWLRFHSRRWDDEGEEDGFECVDEASKAVLDCSAKDLALEDLMYALDKGIEQGVVPFGTYIRQVRVLAREQFSHRAMVQKLKGS